ncbi:Peroxyureidoacrylate/ureidoacrylate amidohydrolase RutB [Alphaproteobacteria bacterium SO-S41]|nr:Peroxyureidoacrylate/ureidoacrylate amidohydrolase RutB [Alphaproteobacteria bacterium SO-S41]
MTALGSSQANLWQVGADAIDVSRGAARTATIAARPKRVTLDLAASAIIVIDMQALFCRARPHETSAPPTAKPIQPLERMLPVLRKAGVPVIWVNWGNRTDKLNIGPSVMHSFAREGGFRPPILDKGSADAAIVDGLTVGADDIHVDKYRVSGFWDSELDSVLRNLRVTTLFFAGVNLDQCVHATLLDAHCLNYDCVLVEDCCATRSPDYCTQATLYNVERGMGFVTDSAAVVAALA